MAEKRAIGFVSQRAFCSKRADTKRTFTGQSRIPWSHIRTPNVIRHHQVEHERREALGETLKDEQ